MPSIYDTDLPRTPANHAPLTPLAFIQRTAEVYSQRLAIVHGALRQTWAETCARCRRLASALRRAGIGKHDTVAVMLPNTPPMVEAHFGIPMAGAVLNALNPRLVPEAVAFMLDHGEAKAVVVDPPCAFVELKSGAEVTGADIVAHCKRHLAGFKVPRAVVFGELPKTSTGKIQKFALRQQVGSAAAIDV
ncbi:AMP-binding protein [Ottowia sp.]|uniref:AMP-binding protein n=1 Tax=Ottowia sp. TaxID=1898956 RepID=UPI0039E6E3C1